MAGDAGGSQLNPIDADDSLGTQAETEDTQESEVRAEPSNAEDEPSNAEDEADSEPAAVAARGPSRVDRAWLVGIAAVLVIITGGIGFGGYYALHMHREMQELERNDAAALKVAIDCVAATQAPDINAMAASQQKIIDCGTDQYRTQALLYSSMLVQAYQAANVHLQVSQLRAAVEGNTSDGSVKVLVALRVTVSNDQAQNQESGYRLRATMTPTEGTYKISKLEQVKQ
ncbi:Mce protein [Mycobacterium vicinigordonae]|uniref:Mce protein n=1 Tax=Mycobacterium vicinigordonae TaxID=1719132 RepID=A0A7D6E966_9MYCO|nr:Mce protein [Mycobacterium vicinigordonae]QLL07845.1 Mce protein [Mycobacterium vicinigordonae]